MDVQFLSQGELASKMEELVSDSVEIAIASAFMNFQGLSLLKGFLTKYANVRSLRVLLDQNFHSDDSTRKRILLQLADLPNTDVRIFCDKKKLFHAKMYCFKGKETVNVVVGSSNLTGAGLLHNVEINAVYFSSMYDSKILKLNDIYEECWQHSTPVTEYIMKTGDYMAQSNFKVGDKVTIDNKPDLGIGTIVEIDGNQVDIFFKEAGIAETAHVNDIKLAFSPWELAREGRYDDPWKFDFRTQALYLPISNRNGVLSNSIIEILPHQILAAHKVVSSDSRRFLLADEVGLGKTFEAGIIIKELLSRDEARRILLITPAGLVEQWQEDMDKFGMDYTIYRSGMETAIKDFWNKMSFVIASIDTLKVEDHLSDVIKANDWGVVVFDEAHHLTRKDYGLKADKSDRYIVGEKLKDKTHCLLFLTATPHQGDRNKFYNLVNLLDDKLFEDDDDLFRNRDRLRSVMVRQRKIDVTDEEGKPLFVKRIVTTLTYPMSEDEKRFFASLNRYLTTGYKIAEQDSGVRYRALGFVMTTFQKIAASSISAVKTALEERLIRLLFVDIVKAEGELTTDIQRREIIAYRSYKYSDGESEDDIFAAEKKEFERYLKTEKIDPDQFIGTPDEIQLLKNLLSEVPGQTETKLVELLKSIAAIKKTYPDEKVIIFTEYLATQDYIVEKLKQQFGEEDVVFIRGGDHKEKVRAAKTFKKSAHFLVSTQAGGEGINLQHCHIVINYDMPWNPMKVEQRIGRIHRYKQKDTAQVYNMFAKDTIEERIYRRLDSKLLEITETIGSEDEKEAYRENILGILSEELNFDELYKEVLQKGQQADEITKEKIDSAIERAKEVYKQLGDFTQELDQFSLEKYFKTKSDVTLADVRDFVCGFVRSEGKKIVQGEEEFLEFIVPDIIGSYGGQKYRRITFDRDEALEDPTLEFMGIGHHVTDAIIRKCSGYGYGGRCVRRQISNSTFKGSAGAQCNYLVEYRVHQSGSERSAPLCKELHMLMFDKQCRLREEWTELGLVRSEKKVNESDFDFVDHKYLKDIEKVSEQEVKGIVEKRIGELQKKHPNVVYKKRMENLAVFVVK